ncbi:hypothetical protein TNCT_308091 [Trichonephila clavata]|uniref:Uncharacterized protein n=1 Tax=Trichonephila clavata TaxID=2740835 RepID=A0A8X6KV78_TRICU|nr:hypothetical protein TNCT_308091 [Trichonephila clavata]
MTTSEAADESQDRSEKSSQCPPEGAVSNIDRQAMSGRSSPWPPQGAANNNKKLLPGRSSPYQLRSRRQVSERQKSYRKSSPYTIRIILRNNEKQGSSVRRSLYLIRAGGVETAKSKISTFRPYKQR